MNKFFFLKNSVFIVGDKNLNKWLQYKMVSVVIEVCVKCMYGMSKLLSLAELKNCFTIGRS